MSPKLVCGVSKRDCILIYWPRDPDPSVLLVGISISRSTLVSYQNCTRDFSPNLHHRSERKKTTQRRTSQCYLYGVMTFSRRRFQGNRIIFVQNCPSFPFSRGVFKPLIRENEEELALSWSLYWGILLPWKIPPASVVILWYTSPQLSLTLFHRRKHARNSIQVTVYLVGGDPRSVLWSWLSL